MAESIDPPLRQPPGPQTAFITACEVLTWIGLGTGVVKEKLDRDAFDAMYRWSTSNLNSVLEALEARSSPEPFYAVHRSFTGFQDNGRYPERCLSPEGPVAVRWIRARARKRFGRLVSFAELASELRAEIEENRRMNILLHRATEELVDALRSERITAFGQRHLPNGSPNNGAPHDPIPVNVFIHPDITVTAWNQVTVDPDASIATWSARRGLDYSDVRFKTADVLRLWPAQTGGTAATSADDYTAPPPADGGFTLNSAQCIMPAASGPGLPIAVTEATTGTIIESLPTEGRARLPYQENLFRAEYRTRIERWKLTDGKFNPPTPDADRIWAGSLFVDVPRTALRTVRGDLAPNSWKRPGKRSGMIWPE